MDIYRQIALNALARQHQQQADALAADYQAWIAELDREYASAWSYAASREVRERAQLDYQARVESFYAAYIERCTQLQAETDQQVAAVEQQDDARAAAQVALGAGRAPSPYDGRYLDVSAPAYGVNTAPQIADDTQLDPADSANDPSFWRGLAAWLL